jgi:H+/Cl- antiporter ClcA
VRVNIEEALAVCRDEIVEAWILYSKADMMMPLFKLQKADKKTLLIAAVAAGFGGVFGTPISGAIFGLEFFLVGIIIIFKFKKL